MVHFDPTVFALWVVPFLLVARNRAMFWCYEAAATYALVVFYLLFFPDILFGALEPPRVDVVSLIAQYIVSQTVLSLVCAAGVIAFGARAVALPGQSSDARAAADPAERAGGRAAVPLGEQAPLEQPANRNRPGLVVGSIAAYYLLVLIWEVLFVARLS